MRVGTALVDRYSFHLEEREKVAYNQHERYYLFTIIRAGDRLAEILIGQIYFQFKK